jgi:hypothetical protein
MRFFLAIAAASTLIAPAPVAAKNISITLAPTVEVTPDTFTIRVKIGNSGDEAAQSVTPILHFGDSEARGQTKQSLGPNESFDQSLSVPLGDRKPGRWPFQLRVDYTDANQYPFQALQVNAVLVGQPPPAKLSLPMVKPDPLATTSALNLRLKNLTGAPRTVAVSVLVPEGLDVAQPVPPVALVAWEDKPVTAQLVNRSALAGSKYPVYVTAEYDDEGAHQAVIAQSVVEIVAATSFFEKQRSVILAGAVILGVLWLAIILWRVSGRQRVRPASDRR